MAAGSRGCTGTNMAGLALAAALLLLLVYQLGPAEASWITVYEGPGCTGRTAKYYYYCHDLAFRGGYDFVYQEDENGYLFFHDKCSRLSGEPECPAITQSQSNCTGVPFRSIYISKPPPDSCWIN